MIANEDTALATLAREELGVVPEEIGSPWTAALTSLLLFSIGAVIPVLPYFVGAGLTAIAASALLSALALFTLGAGTTLLTGRSALFAGLRQVVLGLLAAVVTFAIGSLIGAVAGI